jgi:hypothetical protein
MVNNGRSAHLDATIDEQAILEAAAHAVVTLCEARHVELHNLERFGQWHDVIYQLALALLAKLTDEKPDPGRGQAKRAICALWDTLAPQYPLLAAAVEALLAPPQIDDEALCPPLPDVAQVDVELAAEASLWLDEYIEWSKRWAPRAFADFHEACALFVLATAAARRVRIEFGHGVYPSLYLALTARTTLYTKSTAADLAIGLLKQAGLESLLAHDDATPQAFLRAMAAQLPENYAELSWEERARLTQRLAFAAQRGWYFGEFGQHLTAMMQREGVMAAFRGLLRRFDDHPEAYTSDTIGRGAERLIKPALTLLVTLTPADLKPFAGPQSPLWRDGYFARFAFIAPPPGARSDAPFLRQRLTYPIELLKPLQVWHQRLGVPGVDVEPILDKKRQSTGRYRVSGSPLPERSYALAEEVWEAFYRYDSALRQLASVSTPQHLDGSYGRLAIKALRIAGLLASLHDDTQCHTIQLRHWHRGQQIAERWRASLHRLVVQLDEDLAESRQTKVEGHIVRTLKKHGVMTKRDLQRRTGIAALELMKGLEALRDVGLVEALETAQTTKYRYAYETLNGDNPHD